MSRLAPICDLLHYCWAFPSLVPLTKYYIWKLSQSISCAFYLFFYEFLWYIIPLFYSFSPFLFAFFVEQHSFPSFPFFTLFSFIFDPFTFFFLIQIYFSNLYFYTTILSSSSLATSSILQLEVNKLPQNPFWKRLYLFTTLNYISKPEHLSASTCITGFSYGWFRMWVFNPLQYKLLLLYTQNKVENTFEESIELNIPDKNPCLWR